jgi:hypothetical protein
MEAILIQLMVIDKRRERAESLRNQLIKIGYSCVHYFAIGGYDTKDIPVIWDNAAVTKCRRIVENTQVVFLHIHNEFAVQFGRDVCENLWVVYYSGGSISEKEIPYLEERREQYRRHCIFSQPIGDDVTQVSWNLKGFLEAVAVDNENSCSILHGYNPRLEAGINLLEMFLPIDIELQTRDLVQLGNSIREFETKLSEIPGIINKIMGLHVTVVDSEVKVEDRYADRMGGKEVESLNLLNGILNHVKCIRKLTLALGDGDISEEDRGEINEELDRIFGLKLQEGKSILEQESGTGFHRIYEKLRDCLLKIVT